MSQISIIDTLARSPLFSPLGEAERKSVAAEMRPVGYEPGTLIFSRGDAGRDIYLVLEGRVRLSVLTPEGRELSFWHAEPGHIFGEIAVLDGGLRSADATSVNKVKAYTLSQAAMKRLIVTKPAVAEAAIQFLCARLRDADQQLEAIALHPIEVRLARFFLATAKQRDPDGKQARIKLDLGMNQSELALLIGASRPKVNAALSLLEEGGAIERQGSQFVCAIGELEQLAGHD